MEERRFKFLDLTLSVSAGIIALAALLFSVYQGYETREHNKLSVKPRLTINTDTAQTADFCGMSIANDGLGPGEIWLIRLYVDGQPIADARKESWPKVLEKLDINMKEVNRRWLYERTLLTAGSSFTLFGIPKADYTDERAQKMEQALERLGVIVCYCSLYNECDHVTYGNVTENPCSTPPQKQ